MLTLPRYSIGQTKYMLRQAIGNICNLFMYFVRITSYPIMSRLLLLSMIGAYSITAAHVSLAEFPQWLEYSVLAT